METVKTIRTLLGYSQTVFARSLGVAQASISRWELGKNSPTLDDICNMRRLVESSGNEWKHDYTREMAAFPLPYLKQNKLWATVARVNDSHGDRHLICTCAPIEDYMEE